MDHHVILGLCEFGSIGAQITDQAHYCPLSCVIYTLGCD